MSNDDLDNAMGEAMGEMPADPGIPNTPIDALPSETAPEPKKRGRSKKELRTPPIVAPKVEDITPEPQLSYEMLKMQAKIDALQELLIEQRELGTKVMKAEVKARVVEAETDKVDFRVNLPVQAADIKIDGRAYYHGHTYRVGRKQAITMQDIQFNAWKHDEQVQGQRAHAAGIRTKAITIDGATGNQSGIMSF